MPPPAIDSQDPISLYKEVTEILFRHVINCMLELHFEGLAAPNTSEIPRMIKIVHSA